jgi:hypothetical protein
MAAAKYERGDPREKALGLRWLLRGWSVRPAVGIKVT